MTGNPARRAAKGVIRDQAGNTLLGFRPAAPEVTASLVVVSHGEAVLMMFDSWRKHWELPGGGLDPGETAHEAAVRELREETGIDVAELEFVTMAEFDLVDPERHEFLAIYRTRLDTEPRLVVNEEALAFRWWTPSEPVGQDMSPIDAYIARHVR
ncbi:NUDIX hydrolase [Kibdelosporangium persicum]|nr:NUDIX hydrolase [Kibdelosporangium persicum]